MKKKNEDVTKLLDDLNSVLGDTNKSAEIFYLFKKQVVVSEKQHQELIGLRKRVVENQQIAKAYAEKYIEWLSILKQQGELSQVQQNDLVDLEEELLGKQNDIEQNLLKLIAIAKTLKIELPKTFDVTIKNTGDFPTEFRISNLSEIPSLSDEVHIKKPLWLPDFFEATFKFITQPVINAVKKQLQNINITGPTDPSKAIAVRLSDGKRFYTAIMQAIAGATNTQEVEDLLQNLVDGNVWQRAVLAGTGFVATTNNITVANANETVFMLIKNPSNSGKTARLHRLTIGSDQNQANKMAFYRIYRDPTVTNNGTALNINNLKKGAGVSVLTAFRIPSISDNGMLLVVGNAGAVIQGTEQMDLGNLISAGENILITVDATAGGFDFFVTAYWEEV